MQVHGGGAVCIAAGACVKECGRMRVLLSVPVRKRFGISQRFEPHRICMQRDVVVCTHGNLPICKS